MEYTVKDKRLYLRLGDRVTHLWHEEWGEGAVVEERTSMVPGGTCLVRLLFEDGKERTFSNDLDNEQCCYFFGVRRLFAFSLEEMMPTRVRVRPQRPALAAPAADPRAVAREARRRPARQARRTTARAR